MLLLTLPLQQQMLNDNFLQSVTSLICNKTGIKIRPEDHSSLLKKIRRRVQSLKLKDELEYLELLTSRSRESKAEWDNLIGLITTGESYFFRDRGQIKLIQEHLLPDLIEKRQAQRSLNILSAGCSTGEEVYSLAIIIKENFPELDNWDVNLVGIDLNREAINKVLQGMYPDWSFRGVDNRYRLAYFRRQKAGWQIIDSLKHGVSFRQCNLVEDDLSFFSSGVIDLIICRNVFIYFDRDKISLVLRKFIDLLRLGGYLLTGHTEMQEQDITPLVALSYWETLQDLLDNVRK
jgi:chemotaxis protein methyltransferase CheR